MPLTFPERSGTERSTMTESSFERALETLEKTFRDRIRRPTGENETKSGALASVLPLHAEEVELLARWAARAQRSMKCGRRSPATTSERTRQWTPAYAWQGSCWMLLTRDPDVAPSN